MSTIPMLTLAKSITSESIQVRFDQTKLGTGPVTLTASLTDGTYRNDLSTSSGLIGHLITRLNAAETAAGTDGVWAASNPSGIYRAQVRLTRTPGSASDDVKDIRYSTLSATMRELLGIDASKAAPTGAGVAGATCTWTTRHLGYVWTPDRHPLRDWEEPLCTGAVSNNGAGYGALIVESAMMVRQVELSLIPGGLVLSDLFTRQGCWAQVDGLTANDTNAPLDVLWSRLTGGGSTQPNNTLRYYPDRDDPSDYQDVQLELADDLFAPARSGAWTQTSGSPNLWSLRFGFIQRY